MLNPQNHDTSRRDFIKTTGKAAAITALAGAIAPRAHAGSSDLIQVALIGCGGRGSGAAKNALSTKSGPIKLVAMGDAYAHRLKGSFDALSKEFPDKQKMDVPDDRRFVGFDAYKKAIDCLKAGDVAIFATPLAFRWVHFQYAIQKGVNVFMEKPLTADGPTSKRMLQLAEDASAKNLKCGVGLMSRHAPHMQELHKRIQDGELGDIIAMRGYRMQGPVGHFNTPPKPKDMSELDYQVQRFHALLWAGGGAFSDFYIHIIDHLSWMKNAWPVKAMAIGGRHFRQNKGVTYVDQNFDSYAVEYTFPDGTKMFFDGRCMTGAENMYSSFIHGSKGLAIAAKARDCDGPSTIFKGHIEDAQKIAWQSKDDTNPYQNEWDSLIDAIRKDKPYNEVKRGVEASVVTSMGRMSAHIGQTVTYEQMLNCEHEFAPGIDKLTSESPAPVTPDANGMYPQPEPGIKKREY
ncbi:MAG TPA: Gfo/Idh/MocA family oxidoreductase [Planctomycetota bacterium]|nr:Gfo/Idh/MocA family oxidoreductase [Planctomycetota bacterium]